MGVRVVFLALTISLAGCVSAPSPQLVVVVEFPDRGGSWDVEATSSGGETRQVASLGGAEKLGADGQQRLYPVLRIDKAGRSERPYLYYLLGPSGIEGWRTSFDTELGGLLAPSAYESDYVSFVPNEVLEGADNWMLLGPGLWGRELEEGVPAEIGLNASSGSAEQGSFLLKGLSGGCAEVEVFLGLSRVAVTTFCGDPLPNRIEVFEPRHQLVFLKKRVSEDGPFPPFAAQPRAVAHEFRTAPPDGSRLPFRLEEARRAIEADARASGWLAAHSTSTATQGAYRVAECGPKANESECPARNLGTYEPTFVWRLHFGSDTGDWMEVYVAKGNSSASIPLVTSYEEGSGRPLRQIPKKVASLDDALRVWDNFHNLTFRLRSVTYDLEATNPAWVFLDRQQPSRGGGTFGFVENSFLVDMGTGLVRHGVAKPITNALSL